LQVEKVEGKYQEGRVNIFDNDSINFLHERGYGELDKERQILILEPYEVLYLTLDKKMTVTDLNTGHPLEISELLERFRTENQEIWSRYLVYRDLRDRGYVVREGFEFGIDFRVYDRGQYGKKAAKYIVLGMNEGTPVAIKEIVQRLSQVKSLKKDMILAVIDRRGEVVYYSVTQMVP